MLSVSVGVFGRIKHCFLCLILNFMCKYVMYLCLVHGMCVILRKIFTKFTMFLLGPLAESEISWSLWRAGVCIYLPVFTCTYPASVVSLKGRILIYFFFTYIKSLRLRIMIIHFTHISNLKLFLKLCTPNIFLALTFRVKFITSTPYYLQPSNLLHAFIVVCTWT